MLDDTIEAFEWYEARATGLGHDFVRTFYAAVAAVQRQPPLARVVQSHRRRVRLRRFPYQLYFQIGEEEIVFLSLHHAACDPIGTRRLLRQRRESD